MMRRLAFCLPVLLASTLFALPACGGDGDGGDGGGGGGGGGSGTITGTVTVGGAPGSGLTVRARVGQEEEAVETTTDEQGRYTLEGLEAGDWTVTVLSPSGEGGALSIVTVDEGETETLDFEVETSR